MLLTMLSGTTQESTGSASLSTSTGSFGDWLLLERNTGVYEEKDICTTRHALQEGQPGRGTTHFLSDAIADAVADLVVCFLLYHPCFWVFCISNILSPHFETKSWALERGFEVVFLHLKLVGLCDEKVTHIYPKFSWGFLVKSENMDKWMQRRINCLSPYTPSYVSLLTLGYFVTMSFI